jgi:hypothetical protein
MQTFQTGLLLKNDVFSDITSCGSYKNRRSGGTYRLHHQDKIIRELGTTLAVTNTVCASVASYC